jgi:hypothetical protein
VRAKFVEQDWAEHHVAILATFAALDVENHALAVHIADLQASQLRVPNASRVQSHARQGSGVDELGYFFLNANGGQTLALGHRENALDLWPDPPAGLCFNLCLSWRRNRPNFERFYDRLRARV